MSVGSLLRARDRQDSSRVGFVELFFDLVFVFAITQLSHVLLAHPTPLGALQTSLLLAAVWWVWIYTSWVTNWLDPERVPVQVCLFALMLAGLVMSASLPRAFEDRGWAFTIAYVAMQVGRTLFMLWCVRGASLAMRRNFQRILVWMLVSAVFWLIGAQAEGAARFAWWSVALAFEFVAPILLFRVPGLGASNTADWDVDGNHMAERCGLFVIIALGESLLVTGATFAELTWRPEVVAGFVVAVLGSIAMWWVYFDTGAKRAHHRIAHSDDPGRLARLAYTYMHLPIVAGIIVSAVADEMVLAHPGHADGPAIAAIIGGPALYLLGNALFKWVTNDRRWPPLSHLAGLALLSALVVPASMHLLGALALATAVLAVLGLVAVWEHVSIHRAIRRPVHPAAPPH